MYTSRQRRIVWAWLLCIAMLMTALAPALSHALAPDRRASTMLLEVCSAMGTRYVKAPDADTSDQRSGAMNDCPYCRVHADAPLLPPALPPLPSFAILAERPALFYHSPTPLHAWVIAHPRGPPSA